MKLFHSHRSEMYEKYAKLRDFQTFLVITPLEGGKQIFTSQKVFYNFFQLFCTCGFRN